MVLMAFDDFSTAFNCCRYFYCYCIKVDLLCEAEVATEALHTHLTNKATPSSGNVQRTANLYAQQQTQEHLEVYPN